MSANSKQGRPAETVRWSLHQNLYATNSQWTLWDVLQATLAPGKDSNPSFEVSENLTPQEAPKQVYNKCNRTMKAYWKVCFEMALIRVICWLEQKQFGCLTGPNACSPENQDLKNLETLTTKPPATRIGLPTNSECQVSRKPAPDNFMCLGAWPGKKTISCE